MRKKKRTRGTINRRVGIVAGVDGALAQLGFFHPHVQRVVKRWTRVPLWMIHEYFFAVAPAAKWTTNEMKLRVYARAHWPLVWELAAACEMVRNIPKTDPVHWLLRINLCVWSTCPDERSWGDISREIRKLGGRGCDFSPGRLRVAAKRLRLVAPPELTKGYLESSLAVT